MTHYYFFDEEKKTIWYSDTMLTPTEWFVYLGESGNPNPKAAGAALMQQRSGPKVFGCKIKKYIET